mgnify:CR=1 FL=1
MTGFAGRRGEGVGWNWVWDIRAVNGKGLDLRLRLPESGPGPDAEPFGNWTAASFEPPDADLLGVGELPPRLDDDKLAARTSEREGELLAQRRIGLGAAPGDGLAQVVVFGQQIGQSAEAYFGVPQSIAAAIPGIPEQ